MEKIVLADTKYTSSSGDMVDEICEKFYGSSSGTTEAVYAHNFGLADYGPVLPSGVVIMLPILDLPKTENQLIKLWD